MKDLIATVVKNAQIAQNIFEMTLVLPEDVGKIHGGQFLNISTGDSENLLRRPFGIVRREGDSVTICYQVKGGGTKKLSHAKQGDKLSVLLPLGNWFDLDGAHSVALIGGGVGIFPLVATVREHCKDVKFYSYIGFRNIDAMCLTEEFEKSERLVVVTDDGSYGARGNAVDAFICDRENIKFDKIIACGPPVMLKALKGKIEACGIDVECLVSLEERMGCGLGACLVCVCDSSDGEKLRVCRDGPVFDIRDVKL